MPQAIDCDLFLYADNTCLLYQHKDLDQINKELKNFVTYVTGLSLTNRAFTLGTIKTKSVLFSTKNKKRKIGTFEIKYGNINIKQYLKVTNLGCELDENLSGEVMALKIINKINIRLCFLYRKNRYVTVSEKAPMQCNNSITFRLCLFCLVSKPEQKIEKQFKSKLQTIQNKCTRFCLQLDCRSHTGIKKFEQINWLLVSERFNPCICSNAFKFFNENCPLYL